MRKWTKAAVPCKRTEKHPSLTTTSSSKRGRHHVLPPRKKQFAWMGPSKEGLTNKTVTRECKDAKEHSIRYYIFNTHRNVTAVGMVVHGERDVQLTSPLTEVMDDIIYNGTGHFEPIKFFGATLYLHDKKHKPIKNDRNK